MQTLTALGAIAGALEAAGRPELAQMLDDLLSLSMMEIRNPETYIKGPDRWQWEINQVRSRIKLALAAGGASHELLGIAGIPGGTN